jgi:uncharacterized phage infection (PIP) family protein YhgE
MKEIIKEIGRNLKDPWYWVGLMIHTGVAIIAFMILTKLFAGVWLLDLM